MPKRNDPADLDPTLQVTSELTRIFAVSIRTAMNNKVCESPEDGYEV